MSTSQNKSATPAKAQEDAKAVKNVSVTPEVAEATTVKMPDAGAARPVIDSVTAQARAESVARLASIKSKSEQKIAEANNYLSSLKSNSDDEYVLKISGAYHSRNEFEIRNLGMIRLMVEIFIEQLEEKVEGYKQEINSLFN